ncbi:hypothetical protein M9H77_19365 [Catharanthus roseus]|uniref:Uncharacterized protein n=1 Tax=Catharanthus roseus TaxID=4058 RepID=A0ACC0BA42_CATRO|nr:hypothetical protein M9H77_19365 [Catharanthus roseus]
MKRFVFDKETLEEMKQLVSSKSSSLKDPTKVEMVSAFIWKHIIDITIAKNPNTKIRSFGAFHVVDLRRRLSLPSLSNAMGNFGIMTLAKWGEDLEYYLADQKDRDYCNLVTPLRTAIRRKDYNDYIQNEEKKMEFFRFRTQSDPEMEYCFFTSWCKLPFYQVDYGWGKPFAICYPVLPVKNVVTLMDTKSGDGIEATITMVEDEMAMLPTQFLDLENNDFSK